MAERWSAAGIFLAIAMLVSSCSEPPTAPTTPSVGAVQSVTFEPPGEFTLTFVFDAPCVPANLRTRVYGATVTPFNSAYAVEAHGQYLQYGGFLLRVGDHNLSFEDDMGFWESFPGFTYFEFDGAAETTVDVPTLSALSMPYSGSFSYCVLKSERGLLKNCHTTPADQVITRSECSSLNNRVTLERR